LNFIHGINKSIEKFLEMMGGEKYCKNIFARNANSMDLAIYSAYKGQLEIFGEQFVLNRIIIKI
jgi:hypothetical protein